MLELYMQLFEARSVNFQARGSAGGIGRDEILGAAAIATKKFPIGNRIVLAEMGDEHSINVLACIARINYPSLMQEMVAAVMDRPLPGQIDSLVRRSARYKRENNRARELKKIAIHLAKTGKPDKAAGKEFEAEKVLESARNHVIKDIMTTGKCPACRGAGVRERKHDQCAYCLGRGNVHTDMSELKTKLSPDDFKRFTAAVDAMRVERQEWINVFMKQITKELAA